jgi:hypothetical protein
MQWMCKTSRFAPRQLWANGPTAVRRKSDREVQKAKLVTQQGTAWLSKTRGKPWALRWGLDLVVLPMGCKPFSSFSPFSNSSIGNPVLSPIVACELPLYLPGTGRASQETAISGSCQQALFGICHSVWVWLSFMGWIPKWGSLWMVIPSVSAPNFVSITPSMGICSPLLRRILSF